MLVVAAASIALLLLSSVANDSLTRDLSPSPRLLPTLHPDPPKGCQPNTALQPQFSAPHSPNTALQPQFNAPHSPNTALQPQFNAPYSPNTALQPQFNAPHSPLTKHNTITL
ncbi:hypothetical protein E2C01_074901 [Portunus trituberculatus]|uniref:Uncharacterized protein n=1 Tax=Portunus trituberculatus TaxID=210409 RepID=A0A5B7IDH6_PORTR|nr:hypothetical protein [Portunus trituberculatus]